MVEQGNRSVNDSIRVGEQNLDAGLGCSSTSMNATWHSAIKTTPYELVFGRKFGRQNHLDHQRVVYTLEDEAVPLEEFDKQ